jgi:uncharacterized protein (TIGR02646 family)
MLQLPDKPVSESTRAQLQLLQEEVNQIPDFAAQVSKAQGLWRSKNNGNRARIAAFEEVKTTLKSMSVAVEICNYCEHNEASDIEHIYPKSFFPSRTFRWENYLLACKNCNTALKNDRFAILNEADEVIYLKRGTQPANDRAAFINPRIENPNEFIIYDALSHNFVVIPEPDTADGKRAHVTLKILGLNARDALKHARKTAYENFYNRLLVLVQQLEARDWETLEPLLSPDADRFDRNQPLQEIQQSLKTALQKHFQKSPHPSVWYAIKLLGRHDAKWARLFNAIPEALNW